jgi:hypothetical protein
LLHLRYNLTGQRESIFAMILSARAIASEIADSDAGEFLPSHCVNFRAARIQAAIRITRFLPSSTTMSVAYSLFVRYNYIRLLISDFGNLRAGAIGETASVGYFSLISTARSVMERACGILAW